MSIKTTAWTAFAIAAMLTSPVRTQAQEEGDNISREIFIYCPDDRAGLHAAYLDFEGNWQEIGQLCASDYGQWGAEKRMYHPNMVRASDGTWRAVWQLNDHTPCFFISWS